MNMAKSSRRKMKCPEFFKVFMPELHSEHMQIPESFLRSVDQTLPKKVKLKCGEGSWNVRVVQSGHKTFFKKGWKQFIKENGVEALGSLVFHYDGGYTFDVRVFGHRGMMKKPVAVNSELIKVEVEAEEEEKKEGEEMQLQQTKEEKEEEKEANEANNRKIVADEDAEEKDGYLWARKYLTDQDNPFFVPKLGSKCKYVLRFPTEVVRAFNLEVPKEVTFLNQRGKEFKRHKVNKWGDGRICIGGWKRFCKFNYITEKQKCICEVLLGRKNFTIKVHVV